MEDVFDAWQIENHSGVPVYRQIINQACAAVAAGRFKLGDQLPTIRALSERLKVNPNTVAKAYRELEFKGVIASERGNGSFVQSLPPEPQAREKKTRLKELYRRFLTEAAGHGVTEMELVEFIKKQQT